MSTFDTRVCINIISETKFIRYFDKYKSNLVDSCLEYLKNIKRRN